MQFASTGGIFLRLDTSGNLNVYDTSGTSIAKFLTGKLSLTGNKATLVSNSPIGSTTSLTQVDLGQNLQITTQISSTVLVMLDMNGNNGTTGDGGIVGVAVHSGTNNPAGGTADAVGATVFLNTITAVGGQPSSYVLCGLVTVTPGAAATLSITIQAVNGGTFSVNFVTASAVEL